MRLTILRNLLLCLVLWSSPLLAQQQVTSPAEHFGFEIGADYQLATWNELQSYFELLAAESDRMVLDTIGTTTGGRPQIMAVLTSPENHRELDRYRGISERLTRARGVEREEVEELAREGRAVVWIDGGLHADEVLGAQQLIELVYRMASYDDPETLRILDDVILLAAHANPDGHALVADWYMRHEDPARRSTDDLPVLYQEYAGHDNNRDFYMSNLAETTNINRVLYREWYPQIVYNHHQRGPRGTIMFAPPFRDPANHYIDPLVLTGLQQIGAAMHHRFVEEGKGGTTMRSGASYSTWWNGGLRTTPYFHNMLGLLTETRGHPTPIEIPFVPERHEPGNSDLPLPVEPTRRWHFRQSVEYSWTANRAVLDYASRNRDRLLMNAWLMGRRSIERGSRDSWTVLPGEIEEASEVLGSPRASGTRVEWDAILHRPEDRDPRGYILPADQPDFNTAGKFVDALLKTGVEVHRAYADFTVDGTRYPAGSWVVRTDQAFRPHVLDMFEPQDHPDDFRYPGGPPIAPYDVTGWTLAYQMGVEFDRILEGFDGPFEPVTEPVPEGAPEGRRGRGAAERPETSGSTDASSGVSGSGGAAGAEDGGWLLDHRVRDSFAAVNHLMARGVPVYWLTAPPADDSDQMEDGFFVPGGPGVDEAVEGVARQLSLEARRSPAGGPTGPALRLRPVRIGLWDEYGGSIASGWTRFVLESFEFPYELVFARELDEGDLRERFDVLVFPDGAIPLAGGGGRGGDPSPARVPTRWRERLGRIGVETTVPRLIEFMEEGGTVVTVGSSTVLGRHAGLPLEDWLVDERGRPLDRDEHFVPGSVLELALAEDPLVTAGLGERVDVLFADSPVFGLGPGALERGIRPIAWFDSARPLRSGWAWQQHHLLNGISMLEAPVGDGRLFLFGPDITFRGQTHGAFPLLFNAVLSSAGERVDLPSPR